MGNDPGDFQLLALGAFLFTGISYQKLSPLIPELLNDPKAQLGLAGFTIISVIAVCWLIFKSLKNRQSEKLKANAVHSKTDESVYCGRRKGNKKPVYVTNSQRCMHTQVVGTTNAGKTESVILPWAIQDIQRGSGLIIIDGKSDRGLLDKLWSYTIKHNRESDFKLFSLGHIKESSQYNPLIGDSPEEVVERVFSAFEFDNSYYKNIQFEAFSNIIRLFFDSETTPTFKRVYQSMTDKKYLRNLIEKSKQPEIKRWATEFLALSPMEREQRVSGLKASISHFSEGNTAELFNTTQPAVDIDSALANNHILYFQLPVLLSPFLGKASGKMILQNLQNAIANRHRGNNRKPKFFSVFLDDFTEYLYPGFVSILNKSRSANIGVVFAHQALGDIQSLGDSSSNSILTNSNLKIFMRGNDPDSAEYFAKAIGTQKTFKFTERRKKTWIKEENTGDQSAREVDEFIIHPNKFKSELGTGEAIMIVPHSFGSQAIELKFDMFKDIFTDKTIAAHRLTSTEENNFETEDAKSNHKPLIENEEIICV